jgi:hypothetical protein
MAKFTRKTLALQRQTHLGVAYHLHIRVRDGSLWKCSALRGFEEGAEDGPDGVVPSAEPTSAASADGKARRPPKESSCENKPKKE